ncbi:MAG: DUF3037 domain-containing protein [Frankia sp.]
MADIFEYAVVRAVPRVERGECLNVGVILWCQAFGFLGARTLVTPARLTVLDPAVDLDAIRAHLDALARICEGGGGAGPAGALTPGERFRWLTSPRSTVVQMSPVHSGFTDDPVAELDRLTDLLVNPPVPPSA